MIDEYFFLISVLFFIILNSVFFSSLFTFIILTFLFVLFFITLQYSLNFSFYIILLFIIEFLSFLIFSNIQKIQSFKNFFCFYKKKKIFNREDILKEIETSFEFLASENCGALILIQNNDNLKDKYKENIKIVIDAKISSTLLESIFYDHNPLHDGAVIICDDIIHSANVFLPSLKREKGNKKFGARHTAAFNASKETDATIVLLSEEKREMIIYENGEIINKKNFSN